MKRNLKAYFSVEVQAKLKNILKEKRFIHSIGVANMALKLAEKYGLNKKKAVIAGLLHDCARDLSRKKSNYFIKKYNIKFDDITRKVPALWHSYIGPYVAKEDFEIIDNEILQAVKYHTSGNINMCSIAKAVYIADYTELSRKYQSSKQIRAKINTKISLNELLRFVLKDKLVYLLSEGKLIHTATIDMWNKYNNKQ
ncbi:MAG: bis(5'-nucleosyl)-tetraphosphatase (symmetrical) YqeK [bacterium]